MDRLLTFALGLAGAFIGGFVAATFTESWAVVLILQVALAAVLVALIAGRSFIAGRSVVRR